MTSCEALCTRVLVCVLKSMYTCLLCLKEGLVGNKEYFSNVIFEKVHCMLCYLVPSTN